MVARENRHIGAGVQHIGDGVQQREIARPLVQRIPAQHDVRGATERRQPDPPLAAMDHPGGDERTQETLGIRMGVRDKDHRTVRPMPAAMTARTRQAIHHGSRRSLIPRFQQARQIRHAGVGVEDRGQQDVRRGEVSKIVHAGAPMLLTGSILRLGLWFPDFPRTCQIPPCTIRLMTDQ